MATQVVPTMRMKLDQNPRGSATATASMPAANPFEREAISVRPANQPLSMMPGMGNADGSLGFSFTDFFEDTLVPTATSIGAGWVGQRIGLDPAQSVPVTNQPQQMQTPQQTPVPTSPPAQQLPSYQVSPPPPAPAPAGGGASKLPWIIGGVAVLAVGGIFLMRGKRR